MKVYYAHCMAIYNTEQEKRDLETIKQLGLSVINPNATGSEEGYKSEGMAYFQKIIENCDALAFRSNPDGSIPAGVYSEIQHAYEKKIPVFELPCGVIRRSLDVDQTREYLKECGFR